MLSTVRSSIPLVTEVTYGETRYDEYKATRL